MHRSAGNRGYSMEKFVSYEKMNKKAKKQLDAQKRGDWGLCRPATKTQESKKSYRRHEKHRGAETEGTNDV